MFEHSLELLKEQCSQELEALMSDSKMMREKLSKQIILGSLLHPIEVQLKRTKSFSSSSKGEKTDLLESLKSLEAKKQNTGTVLKSKRKKLKELKDELRKSKAELHSEIEALKELNLQMTSVQKSNAQLSKWLNQVLEVDDRLVEHLKRKEELYRKHLGMDITKIADDCVRFTFTNISETAPSEKYWFTLKLDDTKFTVVDCCVGVSDLEQLTWKLNRQQDLLEFVSTMRQQFVTAANET